MAKSERSKKLKLGVYIIVLLAIGLIGESSLGAWWYSSPIHHWEKEVTFKRPLKQLIGETIKTKNGNINGSFFLIAGGVTGEYKETREITITFLAKYEYGYQVKIIPWDNKVYINEIEEGETPYVEAVVYKKGWTQGEKTNCYANTLLRRIFYIPKGSILEKYDINLEIQK